MGKSGFIGRSLSTKALWRRNRRGGNKIRKMRNYKLRPFYFDKKVLWQSKPAGAGDTVKYFALDGLPCFRRVGGVVVGFAYQFHLFFEMALPPAVVVCFISFDTQIFGNIILEQTIFDVWQLVSENIQNHYR
jgi:hypothetical protein